MRVRTRGGVPVRAPLATLCMICQVARHRRANCKGLPLAHRSSSSSNTQPPRLTPGESSTSATTWAGSSSQAFTSISPPPVPSSPASPSQRMPAHDLSERAVCRNEAGYRQAAFSRAYNKRKGSPADRLGELRLPESLQPLEWAGAAPGLMFAPCQSIPHQTPLRVLRMRSTHPHLEQRLTNSPAPDSANNRRSTRRRANVCTAQPVAPSRYGPPADSD